MIEDREPGFPGAISLAVAYATATHQLDTPLVLADPVAKRLVGVADSLLAGILPGGAEFRSDMRLGLVMFDRFADDVVVSAVESGASQLVVLDAGLDTICYRRHYPAVRLFEIDRHDVQTWKRHRLADAGIDIPPTMAYVPLDDSRDRLCEVLDSAGYDFGRSVVVVWLKNVFLTHGQIADTFTWLGKHTAHVDVVLDFGQPLWSLPETTRETVTPLLGEMARVAHPWLSFFTSAQMESELRALDFEVVENLSWTDLLGRYVPARSGAPDPFGGRIVHAIRDGSPGRR